MLYFQSETFSNKNSDDTTMSKNSLMTVEEAKHILSTIRPGLRYKPATWPNKGKCAVAISIDVDHESSLLVPTTVTKEHNFAKMDLYHIGHSQGLPRILNVLDQHSIPATFFIPGIIAQLYPKSIQQIVQSKLGHEIGLHGWTHERVDDKTKAQLLHIYRKNYEALYQVTGKKPVGIRTPFATFSPYIIDVAKQLHLTYDSSLTSDIECFEIVRWNQATNIMELPISWIRDDAPYFNDGKQIVPSQQVLDLWKLEFMKAYQENGIFQLILHPHYMGYRSRIWILEELCLFMKQYPNLWFTTHEQVVTYCKEYSVQEKKTMK